MPAAAPGCEPLFELELQLPRRDMVGGLGQRNVYLCVLELDEVDVAEDVLAV
jgi:hypothetical protein